MSMKDSFDGNSSLSFGGGAHHFLPYHAFDFWLNLALCHALLVDGSEGEPTYQVPVPLPTLQYWLGMSHRGYFFFVREVAQYLHAK
jgi:hypothetical protein